MFKYTSIVFIVNISLISCLKCNDILEAPENKKWTIDVLQTAVPKEIIECLAHLGKEMLETAEADYIWKTIVKYYDGASNIPPEKLMQLHWVTVAVQPEDIYNITFNSIDVIENFGLNYNLSIQQLNAIAERVREDWGGKEPEDYSSYDLIALRQILCAFNRSEIERIHPEAYKEAAIVLGKLKNCNSEVLQGLAILAIQKNAFGPPNTWDKAKKEALGVVADHILGAKRKSTKTQVQS